MRPRAAAFGGAAALAAALAVPAAHADGDAPFDPAKTAPWKQAIAALVAGRYGSDCARQVGDDTMLHAGSPMTFSPDGHVAWAGRSDDLAHLLTSSFGLNVSHGDALLAYGADVKDPRSGDRVVIYGLATAVDGKTTSATATVTAGAVSNLCAQPAPTPAAGADLWAKVANRFIKVSQKVRCVDLKAMKMTPGTAVFSPAAMSFGGVTVLADKPRLFEQVSVSDEPALLTYAFSVATGDQYAVSVQPGGALESIQVMRANEGPLAGVRCTP